MKVKGTSDSATAAAHHILIFRYTKKNKNKADHSEPQVNEHCPKDSNSLAQQRDCQT